mmetsp:Transcript_28846/g.46678  ORF Transcript_28846/g.46678 Transcript_28846/m.46678 type:complete len:300 (-) Transcript_28846:119-1018(-)
MMCCLRKVECLAEGLRQLGMEVARPIGDLDMHNTIQNRTFDYLFFDDWTFNEYVRSFQINATAFLLSFFGHPPGSTPHSHLGIKSHNVLSAHPRPFNSFLGYYVHGNKTTFDYCLTHKKDQALIWGKEARYLDGLIPLLANISHIIPLITTISTGRGYRADMFPPDAHVVNRDCLPREEFRKVLCDSRFLIGMGDPFDGPTAVESLSYGAVYINPRFSDVRTVNGEFENVYTSQHPSLEKIGPPWVYTIDIRNDLISTITQILNSKDETAEVNEIPTFNYTRPAFLERLERIIGSGRPL